MMCKLLLAMALAGVVATVGLATPVQGNGHRELVIIDGHDTTIATAAAEDEDNHGMALSFLDLVMSIILAFNEPAFDYWANVQEEVEALVGAYINQHNMNQVAAFQGDLETLLLRYLDAPIVSDNYPDKNQQASALSMAVISHRYLVMSGDLRFSLTLHFEDIASMHVAVLQDAADTYSTNDTPSQWWVDLNEELKDYLQYSTTVKEELQTFRMDMISCKEDLGSCNSVGDRGTKGSDTCYDVYTVTDGITGETSDCRQLQGTSDCANHCQTYAAHRQREVDQFEAQKVTPVTAAWQRLQQEAEGKAAGASPYYMPAKHV